ncbi:YihY/virulence factor BrkB family protein [Tengunoibacter tsumagoiensis]|uniref:YihY/virulence factor BrkB family protein n=1 Tax=Tengunoibacter tsumagoiensis TaxID=2014871 RepID=A0A402A294_9CHLR|nr:YihY/virulence factor BrkB family protein [Tengunoibacter tsumagoiensis]GCE13175.1 hypothetical protein KTT_30340 [Tengunoibacter tsumagoiensis]
MASDTHGFRRNVSTSGFTNMLKRESSPWKQFFQKFSNDWSMTFAGSLAYSLLTAMLPIAIAVLSILGFILGSHINYILQHLDIIPGIKPNDPTISNALKQFSNGASLLAFISIVLAIFGGSRLFVSMEGCLDIIYRVRPRPLLRQNLIAILMMVLFVILVPIMVFASTLPGILVGIVSNNPSLSKISFLNFLLQNQVTVYLTGLAGGLIAAFILFEAIYVIVPNQKISWSNSWQGALASAIALQLFMTVVFPFYSSHFMSNYVGQIGFAVILLVYFYYFAVILLLGAEINAFFRENVRPLPNDLATFVSTMAGKLNKDTPVYEAHKHVNAEPTEQADHHHIVEAREQEERNSVENVARQQQLLAQTESEAPRAQQKPHAFSSILPSIIQGMIGSTVALIIELFRLRQREK